MATQARWGMFWVLVVGTAASVVQAKMEKELLGKSADNCHCEKVRSR